MKHLIACVAVSMLVAWAVPAQAVTVINSFETGLGAWIVAPDGGTIDRYTSYAGQTATDGDYFAALTCGHKDTWVFMYLPLLNMEAGKVLKFDYFWEARGLFADEYAVWLAPPDNATAVVHEFFELESNVSVPWTTDSYVFEEDGHYFLSIAIRNRHSHFYDSILGIDYVRIEDPCVPPPPPPDVPIPEPLTMMGMVMGVGGLVRYAKKRGLF